MPEDINDLSELYADAKACAKLINLEYIEGDHEGYSRIKRGKGFSYVDSQRQPITDKKTKARIDGLVIPPAWHDVWICPTEEGHILVTGVDEKGRKQYIYHSKWREMRDLLKFYRMLIFAQALPTVRQAIDNDLRRSELTREKVIGTMLWLLDNTYLRIGNDTYLEQNESVGLTTLSTKNLVVAGDVVTLSFRGKSGKQQQITFENSTIAATVTKLIEQRGSRLFRYKEGRGYVNIEAAQLNAYLHEMTGLGISAKDFRTWGGTLMAFNHLVETYNAPASQTPKAEKVAVQAVDAAANVLGNTRTVAKSSYVHPDILRLYAEENFHDYYETAKTKRTIRGLDKRETELVVVLEQLFSKESQRLQASS